MLHKVAVCLVEEWYAYLTTSHSHVNILVVEYIKNGDILTLVINIVDLKEQDIKHIENVAKKEGYNLINRLVTEYDSGENKFDREGEKLIGFVMDDMIVA